MARYKPVDRNPRLLPVVLSEQIQPGTFEFALDHLVDNELDVSALDARFRNDETGASAYDPRVMLKIVLLGYSRGLISSRRIEAACLHNVQFIALSGDSQPSYTHIAKFVRELGDDTLITADAGYHSTQNLQALAEQAIDALIADNQMRQRDERLQGQGKHKAKGDPLYEKKPTGSPKKIGLYRPEDFRVADDQSHCICPAGQKLHSNGSACTINGRSCHKYTGSQSGCGPCEQRHLCLRHPQRTAVRQVAIFAKGQASANAVLEAMKQRIDSPQGRQRYS